MQRDREFYEEEYHYDEDVTVIDDKRLDNFFHDIEFCAGGQFLDIGCGVGKALIYCFKRGLSCVGFDISTRAIRLARNIVKSEIKTLVADGEQYIAWRHRPEH